MSGGPSVASAPTVAAAMVPAARLAIGELVGPYRIVGELGGGGMGMVYRAVHELLHRPAAIKVLRPELGGHAMVTGRFLTEARATTAIRHPGIVEVFDYGHTTGGAAFIAMELLEGQSLAERLARGPLALVDAVTLARRIAAPLAAAHERGVVHRDLKPDNVFLIRDPEGGPIDQVKLLDFGIAKLENTGAAHRTTVGLILGTPAYMSPEQCLGMSACDHRTDLYALGCILFEMLSGHSPYSGVPTSDLLAAHIQRPVPDLARLITVPAEIARLVTRLLAKSADDRPRSAGDVVAELDQWLAVHGRRPSTRPRHRPGRRLALAASAGALVVGLVGLVAWRLLGGSAPSAVPPAIPATVPETGGSAAGIPALSPGAGQPAVGQPSTGQPPPGQPSTGQPTAGQPSAGQPTPGQPSAGQPSAGQPTPGQPSAGQPTPGQPPAGPPSAGQPGGNTPSRPSGSGGRPGRGTGTGAAGAARPSDVNTVVRDPGAPGATSDVNTTVKDVEPRR